jgi:hypothetical protein
MMVESPLKKDQKNPLSSQKTQYITLLKNQLTKPQNAVLLFITGYTYGSLRASILIGRTDPFVVLRQYFK